MSRREAISLDGFHRGKVRRELKAATGKGACPLTQAAIEWYHEADPSTQRAIEDQIIEILKLYEGRALHYRKMMFGPVAALELVAVHVCLSQHWVRC